MDKKLIALCSFFVVIIVVVIILGSKSISNNRAKVVVVEIIEEQPIVVVEPPTIMEEAEVEEEPQKDVVELVIDGSDFATDLRCEELWINFMYMNKIRKVFIFNDISLTDGRYDNIEMRIKRTSRKVHAAIIYIESLGVFESKENEEIYELLLGMIQSQLTNSDRMFNDLSKVSLTDIDRDIDSFIVALEKVNEIMENLWKATVEDFTS